MSIIKTTPTKTDTTVRMSREYHKLIKELAEKSKLSIKAQLEHIIDIYNQNREILERGYWRE